MNICLNCASSWFEPQAKHCAYFSSDRPDSERGQTCRSCYRDCTALNSTSIKLQIIKTTQITNMSSYLHQIVDQFLHIFPAIFRLLPQDHALRVQLAAVGQAEFFGHMDEAQYEFLHPGFVLFVLMEFVVHLEQFQLELLYLFLEDYYVQEGLGLPEEFFVSSGFYLGRQHAAQVLRGYLAWQGCHLRRIPDASDRFYVLVTSNSVNLELVPQLPNFSLMIIVDHFQPSIFLLQNPNQLLILMLTLMKVMMMLWLMLMCCVLMLMLVDMPTDALNQDLLRRLIQMHFPLILLLTLRTRAGSISVPANLINHLPSII